MKPTIGERRYKPRLQPKSGWPELTALIDILFLVLLFFFLASSFVRVSGISVDLPRVRSMSVANMEKFIVTIAPGAEAGERLLYFNDRPITLEGLKLQLNQVRGRSRTGSIVIRADRRVPSGQLMEIMSLAETAGLASFLAVMPPGARPETVFGQ